MEVKETITKKVKAISLGRIETGSIGFKTTDPEEPSNHWYNIAGETEILEELVKNVIAKGNTIEFEYNNGVVGNLKLIEKASEEKKNWAEDMTNFDDLLSDMHKKFSGAFSIKTELISVDYEKSQAIFSAVASVEYEGRITVFTGHGDAQGIKSDTIKPHFIRMAETRAISRALRWATNNAKIAVEETEK